MHSRDSYIWKYGVLDLESKDDTPWACPECGKKSLIIEKNTFNYRESSRTQTYSKIEDYDYDEFDDIRFSAILKCSISTCNEFISVCGNGVQEFNHQENKFDIYFIPKFFYPSIKMIDIPDKCPDNIKEKLDLAFSLYWNDTSACANSIRTAIEYLMDYVGIPKENKYTKLSSRIKSYSKNNPEIANYINSIRHIGNTGSHGNIKKEDIIDALKIIELIFCEIFILTDMRKEVKEISEAINKNGNPRSVIND